VILCHFGRHYAPISQRSGFVVLLRPPQEEPFGTKKPATGQGPKRKGNAG